MLDFDFVPSMVLDVFLDFFGGFLKMGFVVNKTTKKVKLTEPLQKSSVKLPDRSFFKHHRLYKSQVKNWYMGLKWFSWEGSVGDVCGSLSKNLCNPYVPEGSFGDILFPATSRINWSAHNH